MTAPDLEPRTEAVCRDCFHEEHLLVRCPVIVGGSSSPSPDPVYCECADAGAMEAEIRRLTEAAAVMYRALRETTLAFHSMGWHDVHNWPLDGCPIERCRQNMALLEAPPAPSDHGAAANPFDTCVDGREHDPFWREGDEKARCYKCGYWPLPVPSDHGALDVERLAEALFRSQAERRDGFGLGSHEADAAAIAAEYARLATPSVPPEAGT